MIGISGWVSSVVDFRFHLPMDSFPPVLQVINVQFGTSLPWQPVGACQQVSINRLVAQSDGKQKHTYAYTMCVIHCDSLTHKLRFNLSIYRLICPCGSS